MLLHVITPRLEAFDIPQWAPGKWWDLNTSWTADLNGEIPAELNFTESNCRYSVSGTEKAAIQPDRSGSRDVHVLTYRGLLYGDGIVHIQGPFPLNLSVRIKDSEVSGEVRMDAETFDLLSWSRSFEGIIEGLQGNDWEDIGTISIDLTMTWNPGRKLVRFPFEVGDTWMDASTVSRSGEYRLFVDLFSMLEDIQVFDESMLLSRSALAEAIEQVNGVEAVRIGHAHQSLPETVWYASEAGWIVRFRSSGTDPSGVFFLGNWDFDVEDFGDDPATPEPTRTPVPPTVTPTRPPPTSAPPTPTGTVPTPTATYTLPPWIPPTQTPTAGPPTQTPPPPADRPSIRIQSNREIYHAGDHLLLTTTITNPISGIFVMEYIIFELDNAFWFWPDWTDEINGKFRIIPGQTTFPDEIIMEFDWPEIGIGIENMIFWALLTAPGGFEIVGQYDFCHFAYE
ncbi:hypothetical protein JXA40_12245 [bacterium]|nr:hypothetical protein [candidate division CSSED10-310 bacterium]